MTSHQVNDVFDAFVAAKAAIDKVPELERQIAALSDNLSTANEIIDLYKSDLTKAHLDRDTATAAYRAAEEALDTCRKSEADTAARLDLLISTLRDLGGNIGVALSVVEPKPVEPEPVVEVVEVVSVSSDPTPTMTTGDGTSNTGSDPIPSSAYEATLRDRGEGWFDTDNHFHKGTLKEAPAGNATSPFAPLTAEPSVPATPVASIFTTVHHAAPSDGASLGDILRQAKRPDWFPPSSDF